MGKNSKWLPYLCLHGAQEWAKVLCNPYNLTGPQIRGQNKKWPPQPCLLGGPHACGRQCYVTRAFLGVTKQGGNIRNGCLIPAFSGVHQSVEVLRNPCIEGAPKQQDNIRTGCLTHSFSGAHKWEEVLRNPCTLGWSQHKGSK